MELFKNILKFGSELNSIVGFLTLVKKSLFERPVSSSPRVNVLSLIIGITVSNSYSKISVRSKFPAESEINAL